MPAPLRCREVHAERARKGLSLRELADLADVDYFIACRVLKGRSVDPKSLRKLEAAARRAPMPRREVAA